MKYLSIVLFALHCFIPMVSSGQSCDWELIGAIGEDECNPEPYNVLLVNDDFWGDDIDHSLWRRGTPTLKRSAGASLNTVGLYMTNYFDLYDVENGVLTLRTIDQTTSTGANDFPLPNTTFEYLAAHLFSHQRFGYGVYEIRVKTPSGDGLWPASWLFSGNYGWEEIDFYEFFGTTGAGDNNATIYNRPKLNTHNDYVCFSPCVSKKYQCPGAFSMGASNWYESWHIYRVEYNPYRIKFYIDGVLKKIAYHYLHTNNRTKGYTCEDLEGQMGVWTDENKAFPENPMNFEAIVSLDDRAEYKRASGPLDASMQIDYFRHWVQGSCEDKTFTANNEFGYDLSKDFYNSPEYHYVVGKTVTLKDDVEIAPKVFFEVVADQRVILKTGFKASAGGYSNTIYPGAKAKVNFIARLDENVCSSTHKKMKSTRRHYPMPYEAPEDSEQNGLTSERADRTFADCQLTINGNFLHYGQTITGQYVSQEQDPGARELDYVILNVAGSVVKKGIVLLDKSHCFGIESDGLSPGSYYLRLTMQQNSCMNRILITH